LRCEKLAQMPLTAHFVFDGLGRPSVKRGIHVRGPTIGQPTHSRPYWMCSASLTQWCVIRNAKVLDTDTLYNLLTTTSQALGEAEVKLACMSRANVIDLVLTEDSDAMVFGAHRIARE
jgi:Holliday junction resolvase YEN1